MTDQFNDQTLALLESTREARVVTRRADGTQRRTIIWVMVHGTDVYLRSVRGPGGRWFRDLGADPAGMLDVAGQQIPFRAVAATDERSIAACNDALRRKYEGSGGYDAMLREHTFETTIRLEPA